MKRAVNEAPVVSKTSPTSANQENNWKFLHKRRVLAPTARPSFEYTVVNDSLLASSDLLDPKSTGNTMVVFTIAHGKMITKSTVLFLTAHPSSNLKHSRSPGAFYFSQRPSIETVGTKFETRTASRRPLVAQTRPFLALPSARISEGCIT